jgi:putative endonuclease
MRIRGLLRRLWEELLRPRRAYLGSRGTGQRWEFLAQRKLQAAGYTILDRNFRGRAGEIDFVAEEGGVLCFIEVKGRHGVSRGAPAEAVTLEKQRRIFRAAEEYLRRRRIGTRPCRFDVVAVLEANGCTDVMLLRSAFTGPPIRRRRS